MGPETGRSSGPDAAGGGGGGAGAGCRCRCRCRLRLGFRLGSRLGSRRAVALGGARLGVPLGLAALLLGTTALLRQPTLPLLLEATLPLLLGATALLLDPYPLSLGRLLLRAHLGGKRGHLGLDAAALRGQRLVGRDVGLLGLLGSDACLVTLAHQGRDGLRGLRGLRLASLREAGGLLGRGLVGLGLGQRSRGRRSRVCGSLTCHSGPLLGLLQRDARVRLDGAVVLQPVNDHALGIDRGLDVGDAGIEVLDAVSTQHERQRLQVTERTTLVGLGRDLTDLGLLALDLRTQPGDALLRAHHGLLGTT